MCAPPRKPGINTLYNIICYVLRAEKKKRICRLGSPERRPRRRVTGGEDPTYEDSGRDGGAGGEARILKGEVFPIPPRHPPGKSLQLFTKRQNTITERNFEEWFFISFWPPGTSGPSIPGLESVKKRERKQTKSSKLGEGILFSSAWSPASALP
jgi:hypothetical protein